MHSLIVIEFAKERLTSATACCQKKLLGAIKQRAMAMTSPSSLRIPHRNSATTIIIFPWNRHWQNPGRILAVGGVSFMQGAPRTN